jgi:hypothetical protein
MFAEEKDRVARNVIAEILRNLVRTAYGNAVLYGTKLSLIELAENEFKKTRDVADDMLKKIHTQH